ncbi:MULTISPECIES: AAA family ATPase [unclassified Streptomyces]|uniref:AAA family ATPase n=1 Tax=unclassified Streptomyces TaxID=2593676 RepID=UPI0035D76D48
MRLFNRSKELHTLNEAYTECARGNGRLVLITGGPGAGKTQLLHEFLTGSAISGARVLQGTALQAERDRPMGVVRQLSHNGEALRTTPGTGQQEVGARETTESLLRLVDDERPLVLAVDDAQFMDTDSLQAVLVLLRASRFRRVLVVCATCGQPDTVRSAAYTELIRLPHYRARLAPLSERGVGELIAAQTDAPSSAEARRAFHRASGGSPLLLHALLDDSTRLSSVIDRPAGSVGYRQAVLSLVRRSEPSHVRVVRTLAALSVPASIVQIAELAGTTPIGAEQAVEALNSVGLLDGHAFRHPTAVNAVLDDMEPDARAKLHGRIADLLYRGGAPAGDIGRHVRASGRIPRPWGADVLRGAAEEALAADDVELCSSYLHLLLHDCTDEGRRNALSATLARAQWRTNPAAAGAHLEPLRQAALDGELSMRDTATVLRHMLWKGDTELAAEAVATLVPARSPADTRLLTEVELVRQWFYGIALPARSAQSAGTDPRRLNSADGHGALAAHLTVLVGGTATDESAAAVAQALQGHRLDHLNLELVAMALLAIAHADRPETATTTCDTLLKCAVERRATTWQALLGSVRAEIALLQGDMATAAEAAGSALGSLHDRSWGVLVGLPLATAIFAHTAMGSLQEAGALLNRDVPKAMFGTVFGIQYLRARGHYYLVADQPFAALNDFETCSRLMRSGNSSLQKGIPWRSDLALANLRIGKTRTAREWAEEQLRLPGGHSSRARAMALCRLAATSKPHRRASLLREAVDLLTRCGDHHTLAQAYADLSAAYFELGQYSRARLIARQAAEEARTCHVESPVDAHLLEDPAQSEGSEDGSGPAILSDAECRVAGLAALGYTNREISGRLHVTISTVEQHLTRVYRKLNVASRSDLPSKVLEQRIPKLSDHWAATHSTAG